MLRRILIDPENALEYFEEIALLSYRYPAIDPPSFRAAVTRTLTRRSGS